jgi:hypothetical protein
MGHAKVVGVDQGSGDQTACNLQKKLQLPADGKLKPVKPAMHM